ncbi:protein-tyrosine phosphatase 1-like protein [Leptomonas pyrrhocoris]|uniref:Protein-tyrosine phosphatase 1-like protein n=1 Tax=Leptomonas pyrrhocoris TaxID=157538 RepID=A0A0M9G1C1_LEPPY|nr:protein-tyrosine phosphatase 1-like protein [Leptomonas pyrrhocoris]KPA80177.1 protein-tyrosine phosphatase 1-like protein [Leptomonas pyrrhocoris]|eukprot:XP_015658616.1 protein-tyrosine phosphatase 1-like protein [Leptomonas pyrrhocoris]
MKDSNSANGGPVSRLRSSPGDEDIQPSLPSNATTSATAASSKVPEKLTDTCSCEGDKVHEETPVRCADGPPNTPTTSNAESNSQFDILSEPLEKQFDRIEKEFATLEARTMNPRQYNFTSSYAFPTKNRYINVMANEDTLFPPLRSPLAARSSAQKPRSTGQRVLNTLRGSPATAGEPAAASDDVSSIKANFTTASGKNVPLYFNANTLDLGVEPIFVASQAPVLDCMEDFLNAIYNYEIPLILMLTELQEAGFVKAERYWPADKGSGLAGEAFGNMAVYKDLNDPYRTDAKHELIWRPFFIRPCNAPKEKEHKVTMVQYVGWPDRGVPDSTESFEELLRIIADRNAANPKTPAAADAISGASNSSSGGSNSASGTRKPSVLVHCSAGIGRTGTLIGAYAAIKLMEAGKLHRDSICSILSVMRKARFGMVQRIEQYMFLYLIVLQHLGADTTQFAARMQPRADLYNYRWMEAQQAAIAARQARQQQQQ